MAIVARRRAAAAVLLVGCLAVALYVDSARVAATPRSSHDTDGHAGAASRSSCRSSSRRASRAGRWPSASPRSARSRKTQAASDAEALRQRVRGRVEGRGGTGGVPQARARDRGLPLPGDLRVHAEDDREAARRRPARRLQRQLGEGRPALRANEEPDALRRPDHRLDGREGGDRARRAPAGRGRDLQPAARRGCRSGSTRRSATGWTSRHRVADESRSSRATTRTTRANRTGLPPTPIANPGPRLDAGRRAPGEGQLPLLRAQAGPGAPLLHGERVASSSPRPASTATAAAER